MIEFFFDCSSPWTYLAFHNIQPLAREFDEEARKNMFGQRAKEITERK